MTKGKRGDLSINMIVVAAIGVIILAIASVLVLRSGGELSQGASCEGTNQICVQGDNRITDCREAGYQPGQGQCQQENTVCCLDLDRLNQ